MKKMLKKARKKKTPGGKSMKELIRKEIASPSSSPKTGRTKSGMSVGGQIKKYKKIKKKLKKGKYVKPKYTKKKVKKKLKKLRRVKKSYDKNLKDKRSRTRVY